MQAKDVMTLLAYVLPLGHWQRLNGPPRRARLVLAQRRPQGAHDGHVLRARRLGVEVERAVDQYAQQLLREDALLALGRGQQPRLFVATPDELDPLLAVAVDVLYEVDV